MAIATEPIGSIPRPRWLIEAMENTTTADSELEALYDRAVCETIAAFEATGSPVITDGEQRKYHNFWTYSTHGLPNTAADGFKIPFAAGHVRRMLRLTAGPFRYRQRADEYLDFAKRLCASAAEASGHFLLGAEFDVSGGGNSRATREKSSLTISCGSTKTRFAIVCERVHTCTD